MVRKVILIIFIGLIIFTSCKKRENLGQSKILVKIGSRKITCDEFLRRAEYTIRPEYARGSTNIDKKIVFNSLVAEKMLALEAGNDNKLLKNERFKDYITGRKEQEMRQLMFYEEGTKKVKLDPKEIERVYHVAGRTYQIQYLGFPDKAKADSLASFLKKMNILIGKVIKWNDPNAKIPERKVKFNSPEVDVIHNALFSDTLNKGQVIGPLQIEPNYYMVLQVKGFTNSPAITDLEIKQRVNDVKEKLTHFKAAQNYSQFILKIMRGKKLQFNAKVFKKMIRLLKPFYFIDKKKEKNIFINNMFKKNYELSDSLNIEHEYQEIKSQEFYTYNGKIWTVESFLHELRKHPLVFRKRHFTPKEFPGQLRLAIADLLRDKEITKIAYKRGYNKNSYVLENTQMWQDALIAQYQIEQYLKNKGINESDSLKVIKTIKEYLDPYIAKLRNKYKNEIEVNVDAYDSLKLTRIDMFAWRTHVPFPIIVPPFPQFTLYNKLDYGKPMVFNK